MKADPVYVLRRNALIKQAEATANEAMGMRPEKKEDQSFRDHDRNLVAWANAWNLLYHTKMNELWENKKDMPLEYCTCGKCGNRHLIG